DLLSRHPRLIDAIKHIHDENGEGAISRLYSPGYAAGLLYLMACSESDLVAYRNGDNRESALKFSRWKSACDFWVTIVSSDTIKLVRHTIAELVAEGRGSL